MVIVRSRNSRLSANNLICTTIKNSKQCAFKVKLTLYKHAHWNLLSQRSIEKREGNKLWGNSKVQLKKELVFHQETKTENMSKTRIIVKLIYEKHVVYKSNAKTGKIAKDRIAFMPMAPPI